MRAATMPRDSHDPAPAAVRAVQRRPRTTLICLAIAGLVIAALMLDRAVSIRPGAAQRILVSRGGEVVAVYGPGQFALANPWSESLSVIDMALATTDRSAPDRGMPALSAEGHAVTVFGTAFWHHGEEADLRWRFGHIRGDADLMPPLMAASVQAVLGRTGLEAAIRDAAALQAALTEELRARARALLHIEVAAFAVTRLDPGESFRQVVAEREMGRARAASVAASPALATENPNAVEVERIRRWDGHGIIPDLPPRTAR